VVAEEAVKKKGWRVNEEEATEEKEEGGQGKGSGGGGGSGVGQSRRWGQI